jgi:hypothetical protein
MDDLDKQFYTHLKEAGRERRANNREASTQILKNRGVHFTTKNGIHLIVDHGKYDFWPSTGKYKNRRTGKYGRGVFKLLKELK